MGGPRRVGMTGALEEYALGFARELKGQGYLLLSIKKQLQLMGKVSCIPHRHGTVVARQVHQHREPGGSFNQGANRRSTDLAHDQIAFPVARDRPIGDLGWTLADQHHVLDPHPPVVDAAPRLAQRTTCAEAGGQFATETAATLDVECLIDGFVRDPHRWIIRELNW